MKQHVVRWTAWAAVVVSGVFAAAQIQRNFMSPAAAQTPAHASDETSAAASDPFAGMPAAAKETATVGFGDAAAEEPAGTTFVPSATASPYGAVSPYGSSNGGSTLEPARSAYALPSEAGYSPLPSAADAVPPDANAAPAGSTLTPRSAYSAPSPYAALPEAGSLGAAAPAAPGWSVGEPTPAPSNYGLPPVGETVSAEPPATLPSDALPASTTALPPNAASTFAASAPLSAAPVETPAEATPSPAPVRSSPFAAAPAGTGEPSANAFDAEAEPATLPTGSGETASPLTEFAPVESAPLDAFAAPAATPSAVPVDDGLNRTALPARGQGEPGPRELEGPQQPQLTVEKLIPREVQVGAPTLIEIVVRNVGNVPAHRVEVLDSVPKNTELIDAAPHAEADAQGDLVWRLGTLQPQDEGIIRMRVRPLVEGPIGSTAFVSFAVEATCRTIATRPVLQVTQTAPKQVMIDDDVTIKIRITNAGTGVAKGVVLRETMPRGLRHPSGDELEYPVGDLKPGETATLDLALRAVEPGTSLNVLTAYADGELESDPSKCEIAITSPELELAIDGPSRRFLERPATYTLALANPGTASAEEVGLVVKIPSGFDFVKADGSGRWDEGTRTVSWLLAELPAGRTTSTTFTVLPTQVGTPALVAEATADRGLAVRKERQTTVEGVVALAFTVVDTADPIQIGEDTTYEIHVVNQGSKTSKNVRVAIDLPQSMKLVAAEGETAHHDKGGRIIFEPLPSLSPKTEAVYLIKVQGMAAGDLRFRAQVLSDEMEKPVTKEESTQVFADP